MTDVRLAIVTTHPIQYNAPVFQLLQTRGVINIRVFYTNGEQAKEGKFDKGFGRQIKWDLPLLDGYDHCFVANKAKEPGSHHYGGIDNPSLIRDIEDWGATAVLIFGWKFRSHLKALRHFKGRIPVLFRGDSTLLDETSGLKAAIRRQVLRWVYRHIDIGLYVGKHNKAFYLTHGLREEQLVYAPHAVDNDRFSAWGDQQAATLASWKQQLGIRPDDFVILFAGKLIPKKNPDFLLRLGEVLSNEPNIRILMVGNGELEQELKQRTEGKEQFIWLDFQNQTLMPLIYRLGDLFVLPSLGPGETWGLAINEAMDCGLPVAATDRCGGAVDLILPGQNGIIFDPHDLNLVKEYVLDLSRNQDRKEKASLAALLQIKNFNFAAVVEGIEAAAQRRFL